MGCLGTNARGQPCEKLPLGADGFCSTHGESAQDMRAAARAGGEALAQKYERPGLAPGELPTLTDMASALRFFDVVAQALGERRVTDKEAATLTRTAEGFVKALAQDMTDKLNKLATMLHEKEAEIGELRKQMTATRPRAVS